MQSLEEKVYDVRSDLLYVVESLSYPASIFISSKH